MGGIPVETTPKAWSWSKQPCFHTHVNKHVPTFVPVSLSSIHIIPSIPCTSSGICPSPFGSLIESTGSEPEKWGQDTSKARGMQTERTLGSRFLPTQDGRPLTHLIALVWKMSLALETGSL